MSLKINGIDVVNNFKQLQNITGADTATINALRASGLVNTVQLIRKPIAVSPLSGANSIAASGSLTASDYAPLYSADTRDFRQFQISLATDPSFSSPIFSSSVNQNSVSYTGLLNNTAYIWRCRDKSVRGDFSEYMETQTFTTAAGAINTPSITSPTEAATGISRTQTFTSSAFSTTPVGFTTHASSDWQFSLASDFSTILHESLNNTSALTSYTIPAGILNSGTVYYARVRHRGANANVSIYSTTRSFTTLRTNTPSVTSPSSGATNVPLTSSVSSSTFSSTGSDTHQSSTWQFSTDSSFNSIAHQSINNSSSLTSYSIPSGALNPLQTYFVRVLHTGTNGGPSQFSNGVSFTTAAAAGQQEFTTPGTYNFVVPQSVTSISVVVVGGGGNGVAGRYNTGGGDVGGGGGGALAYANSISVTPGEVLLVQVGNRAQNSFVARNSTKFAEAEGGVSASRAGGFGRGGFVLAGVGGNGGNGSGGDFGPGGGAGGYSGNGGSFGNGPIVGSANGSGGGGAAGHGGAGVGIYGQGASGVTRYASYGEVANHPIGGGGSGGTDGSGAPFSALVPEGQQNASFRYTVGGNGGLFGGGGGGGSGDDGPGGVGGTGAARIIWGTGRGFPSSNTGNV